MSNPISKVSLSVLSFAVLLFTVVPVEASDNELPDLSLVRMFSAQIKSAEEEKAIVATSIRWQELHDAYLREKEQESRYRNFLLLATLPFLYYVFLHKPENAKLNSQATEHYAPKIGYSEEADTIMVGLTVRY